VNRRSFVKRAAYRDDGVFGELRRVLDALPSGRLGTFAILGNHPVRNPRYVSGEVAVGDGRTLYISRGVEHLLQSRFNVRPEITLFTLADGYDRRLT
jgi:predicted MPP superfamily phosphohydrolase